MPTIPPLTVPDTDGRPALATQAILVSTRAATDPRLMRLTELLGEAGVAVITVETAEDATVGLVTPGTGLPCVIVDASDPSTLSQAMNHVRVIIDAVPGAAPLVAAPEPTPALVMSAWRAGGGDFLDLATLDAAAVRAALERIAHRTAERGETRQTIATLRGMLEEFLRDLVRTERRSIDLEHQLARQARGDGNAPRDLDENREPVVFIIEDDRDVTDRLVEALEEAGLITFAFLSGEEAQLEAERLASRGEAIDLALVDSRLPGIDGLETIRRLRKAKPGVAAFLMTGFSDSNTAAAAADLGVVGYVLKPFDDVPLLVSRIREQATLSMSRTREHHYLQRIKERHEKVLTRYRTLAAEIDR